MTKYKINSETASCRPVLCFSNTKDENRNTKLQEIHRVSEGNAEVICEAQADGIIEESRKLCNKELHNFYTSGCVVKGD
jgi:hypothetical protein